MTVRRETLTKAGLILAVSLAVGVGGGALARQAAPQAPASAVPTQAPTAPLPAIPRPVQPQPGPITATPVVASEGATKTAETNPEAAKPVQAATTKPATSTAASKPVDAVKRGRSAVAIMQALDKVTTETMRFEAPVGQPIRYKTLIFTVRACETSASDEVAPESTAYVMVDTQPKAVAGRVAPPGRQVYKGWMYANSPGMNPLQHPVYDAWLIACKTSAPAAPAEKR
jgi:hypothetical protein